MRAIQQIAYVVLRVPDVEATAAWYSRALGLQDSGDRDAGAVALSGSTFGPAIVLRPGSDTRLIGVGLTVAAGSIETVSASLTHAGLTPTDIASVSGFGPGLRVTDAAGVSVELSEAPPPMSARPSPGVIDLRKLSHATLRVPALDPAILFYTKALGFRVSDRLSDRFAWMRCNTDHHGVAVVADPASAGLHHVAFELAGWAEIKRACDHLHALGIPLEAGPLRHGPGQNIAIYFRDLNGVRIELTCEMEQIYHDNDRPGHWPGQGTFNVWHDASAPPSWREATPAVLDS